MKSAVRLAVFASGTGTNLENILNYFKNSNEVEVVLIYTNKACKAAEIGEKWGINTFIGTNELSSNSNELLNIIEKERVDGIILAGYLRLIPKQVITSFKDKMLNIHPSLLPKYGGKGMYGLNVHKAVKENGEETSGITIHVVTPEFDKGLVVFQAETKLEETDSPEDIAKKVQALEQRYFPKVIERYFGSSQFVGD